MTAPGETDLAAMLATLDVIRRPGVFSYVSRSPQDPAPADAAAMVDEGSSRTYVVPIDGAPDSVFRAAWLTLRVPSSLDAVGLTAAVSATLGARSIPANVLAGFHHDHLLVPDHLAEAAVTALQELRDSGGLPPSGRDASLGGIRPDR